MSQEQRSTGALREDRGLNFLFFSSIRNKIILPYLLLTMITAIIGIYIVTTLVASSLDERLTNQLLEAGRVVSDTLARQESEHWETARSVALVIGLGEALEEGNRDLVFTLALPPASVREIESLMVVDANGQEVLHVLRQDHGAYDRAPVEGVASNLWIVQTLLEANDPDAHPKRSLRQYPTSGQYYYLTAIPVKLEERMAGVVVVGTSLDTLVTEFRTTSLADVIIYLDGGNAVNTTFARAEQPESVDALLTQLSISPSLYKDIRDGDLSETRIEDIRIRGRFYRLARNPLRVGDDTLGVFAVALPTHFITQAGSTSRLTYAIVFTVGVAAVVLVGYLISQRITNPISRLVRTSQAVAEGNLDQRTGILSQDEIGILAGTFDEMTGRLSERTQKLEETIGRMRAILSSMGDGVMMEDMGGNFITLNTAAEDLLEDMTSSFMVSPLRELTTGGEQDQEPEGDFQPWLLDHRRFEVGNKTISVQSSPVVTDDGEHLGTVIVMRDVTVEVEAERLKDSFITHVSHELRTPLTAIKGYSDLLLATTRNALGEEQRSFLETINRNTDDLMAMVSELLDFSEMEASGRLGLLRRPTHLDSLVQEIADIWGPRIEDKELTFQLEIHEDLPPIAADARRLRWAIIHLIRNAFQYTSSGGRVTVRLAKSNGNVVLDVIDSGIGISPEHQEHLFERFYRVTNMPEDDVRGLGVGLYLANAIVEAHGGNIEVVSEEGEGSKFSIILPVLEDGQDEVLISSPERE